MDDATLHRWVKPDTILVATNLLDASRIKPHAIAQARLSGAKVLLVHVIEPSYLRTNPTLGPLFLSSSPTLRPVQSRLNEIVKEFQHEGVLCEPITLKGPRGKQIPALIHERPVDRVIAGTRGAEALDRVLLGSFADDLLHQVDVPVCVVGPRVRPQVCPNRKPTSILVATSFRSERPPSVQLAVELTTLYQSHLTLPHVVSPQHASEDERQRMRTQAEDQLAAMLTERATLQNSPNVRIRSGDPSELILAFASKVSAELIILGSTDASRTSRLLAAGVVHRVIAEAQVPVITVRQERVMLEEQRISVGASCVDLSEN